MRYLILLNRKFPYKTGEAFLENEIGEISKAFDKVLIYPSDVCLSDKPTRCIEDKNVECHILEKKSLGKRQIIYIAVGSKYYKKSKEKGLIRRILDGYFLSAADVQSKHIIEDLRQINISSDDTVYIYSYWLYITAAVACRLKEYYISENITVKAVSRAHRFDIYEEKRRFGFLPQRINLLRQLDCIYACSRNGANYLKKKYPEYARKIVTSYLGTYDHGIGNYGNRRPLKIVSCSRLSKVKRVNLIIEALSLLEESGLNIEWTHLGGGELFKQLKKQASTLSWPVHMDGVIPNREVYDYYSKNEVDLFINVSSSEGLPVSIMEAISYGIPVIATDVGGTSEIVIDNVSGNLLKPDFEISDLAELIKKYALMNEEEYQNLRYRTRRFWEEHYQAPTNYKLFLEKLFNI